jgi:hypothetical protein
MTSNSDRLQKIIFSTLLLILIPLWNIPHTITGRYICEGLLLIAVLVYKPDWKYFFSANKALLIFFAYLFIQLIFFSTNHKLAFSNFRGEWMHFILFSIIGGGVGLILGKYKSSNILLFLGIAFSIPLYIHITLSMIKWFSLGVIPWGYWGINKIHGDFGYPALQASILFCTSYLFEAKNKCNKILTITLIILCIASPFLAQSRGGTGFVLIGILFTYASFLFIKKGGGINSSKTVAQLLIVLLVLLGTFQVGLMTNPDRWGGILSRITVGLQGNPTDTYCKGIDSLKQEMLNNDIIITPEIQKGLNSVVDGDGARMMAARSGYDLIRKHPMGIDQSKQAFQAAIIEECQGAPKIFISHAHNGWIDTGLAIGAPGLVLLLVVVIQYARLGWVAAKKSSGLPPYGIALFVSAILWTIRALLDSTFRDQMLEMQAFIFAFLLGIILAKSKDRLKEIS